MELDEDLSQHILSLNKDAMSYIIISELKTSIKMLSEALEYLTSCSNSESKNRLLGITYNNLGCIYKRLKKDQNALKYLQLASKHEENASISNVDRASTHLNICAIYSSMKQHDSALSHSQQALALLENQKHEFNYIPTLVIAYHNTAVEHEYLQNFRPALEFYRLAHFTSSQVLGPGHSLTVSTGNDLAKAEKTIKLRETLEVVPEFGLAEGRTSGRLSRVKKINEKIKELKGKSAGKALPYLSNQRIPGRSSDLSFEKVRVKNRSQEKSIFGNLDYLKSSELGTPKKPVSRSPIFSSFMKKRRIVTLPESLRNSRFLNLDLKKEDKEDGIKGFKDGNDLKSLKNEKNVSKSGSLRTKTLQLINEIENLKSQISLEKEISLKRRVKGCMCKDEEDKGVKGNLVGSEIG